MSEALELKENPFELANQLAPKGGEVVSLEGAGTPPAKAGAFSDQIVTAQAVARRRDIADFLNRMKVLASMAGDEYRYQYPVREKSGATKIIEGGSIKMANDLVREYGNCLVDVRVQDQGGEWVIYARFVDYETGFALTRPFRQRKSQQSVKTDAERQLDIAFQIGTSKAIRNVVLNALQTYADIVYDAAKENLVEKIGKNLPKYRDKIAAVCTERGYDLKRIERSVTKPIAEWLAPDVARVIAELKSIGDGMANFDDLYPSDQPTTQADEKTNVENFKDRITKTTGEGGEGAAQ